MGAGHVGEGEQIEVSYNPGTVIGSGSFDGGRPDSMLLLCPNLTQRFAILLEVAHGEVIDLVLL